MPGIKAADAALISEVAPKPPIVFKLDNRDFELPRPFPMRLWLWLLMDARTMPDADDPQWFTLNIASRVSDVLTRLTGLNAEQVESLPTEVTDAVAEQLGEELADAGPFSPVRQALVTIRRAGKLAQAMAARKQPEPGGTPV